MSVFQRTENRKIGSSLNSIWIINHYAGDMYAASGGRHYYFAKHLKEMGYNPTVFCANTMHNAAGEVFFDNDDLSNESIHQAINVPFVFVKARPYSTNGKDRVLNMIDFYENLMKVAKRYAKTHCKPDVILASSVHPLTLFAGIRLAKYFGVKCVCEIRDLWPESIVVYMQNFNKYKVLIKLMYRGERYLYEKADSLIFTMQGGYDYICEHGWDKRIPKSKVFNINNGVDLDQFDANSRAFITSDPDLDNETQFNVVYAGSIRKVNNLGKLLDIAKKTELRNIRYLIWGDGDELPKLMERVSTEKINNVVFKGRVDKKYIPYILTRSNLNFIHNNESPLFRYGISFNKVFDYLAAGKPIFCDFYAKYNPAVDQGAGTVCSANDARIIASEIEKYTMLDDESIRRLCQNARIAAEKYDFRNLTQELLEVIRKTMEQ